MPGDIRGLSLIVDLREEGGGGVLKQLAHLANKKRAITDNNPLQKDKLFQVVT